MTATVRASTGIGWTEGVGSADVAWGQAPGAVTGLTMTPDDPVAPTRAVVAWGAPTDGGIGIDSYRLCFSINGGPQRCETTTGSPYEERLDRVGPTTTGDVVTVVVTATNFRGTGPEASASFTVGATP